VTPEILVRDATAAFLVAVPAIIGYQILTGRIGLDGLLSERDPKGRMVYSPARLQLLLVTVAGAVKYVSQFIHKPTALPSVGGLTLMGVGGLTLMGLGGSQVLYLASKTWAAYQAGKSRGQRGEANGERTV